MKQEFTIYVAMSGGVDSCVAAALLKRQGYNCIGITLKTFCYSQNTTSEKSCCSLDAIQDARAVCRKLDMPHHVMDVSDFFGEKVIDKFVNEYLNGRTPNPCVECNRYVKFEHLMKKVAAMGGDKVATGHYARIEQNGERYALRRGIDRSKDQTYFLWGLTQEELARSLFPVGELSKEETRDIARELGLRVADKVESQEICFVPDNDYAGFVKQQVGDKVKPGPILNMAGDVLGQHKGLAYYTIGQRRGLGLSMPNPVYVAQLDVARNAVIIAENEALFNSGLRAGQVNWISVDPISEPRSAFAQIRYRHTAQPGILRRLPSGEAELIFDEPQRAITPGQSVVFYDDDDRVLAGAVIEGVFEAASPQEFDSVSELTIT